MQYKQQRKEIIYYFCFQNKRVFLEFKLLSLQKQAFNFLNEFISHWFQHFYLHSKQVIVSSYTISFLTTRWCSSALSLNFCSSSIDFKTLIPGFTPTTALKYLLVWYLAVLLYWGITVVYVANLVYWLFEAKQGIIMYVLE